ncbi:MAG TPA: PFL family protein [Kiritimatiellia bacterium]|nr:PFL family protein [Kiritimatiellia bacterium]HOM59323.1 PFL family protein [Kiritimatiellia bacterium]HPK37864.1 PFL family protein [Kiritimatiellia bacterium]HPW76097.1 PFL family protein [Kiritimatiellia bacterium]
MLARQDVLSTLRMVREEHLDVRAVTLGINLNVCANPDPERLACGVYERIVAKAGPLVRFCDEVSDKYALPIVNKRIAVSPVSLLLEGHTPETAVRVCQALDAAAEAVQIDLLGGFSALVQKGMTPGEQTLVEALPQALTATRRVCSSFNVGTTRTGIQVDAVNRIARKIIETAQASRATRGFGCAKIVVFANMPEDNPFMAGALLGPGEPECVINVGVSGPGVVKRAVDRLLQNHPAASLDEIAEEIKHTAFRVTRTGELIGREVAERLGIPFGVVDLSLAPTPRIGDSVGEIYQSMGISQIGAPGTTAAVMLLNDAVKKGGAFASSSVGGLSGAFIPVMEDHALSRAVTEGTLTLEKLEAMTAVCSVGLDMILLPGDTSAETVAGIILDEAAIGIANRKTTGVRVIPVPGAACGEFVDFGGLFGSGVVTRPACPTGAAAFVRRGGRIPAPIHSMMN